MGRGLSRDDQSDLLQLPSRKGNTREVPQHTPNRECTRSAATSDAQEDDSDPQRDREPQSHRDL